MNDQPAPAIPAADEFYVGYLPAPPTHARTARRAAEALAVVIIGAALALAAAQRRPGGGEVAPTSAGPISGVYFLRPLPLCQYTNENGSTRWLLLVGERKFGVGSGPLGLTLGVRSQARGRIIATPEAASPGCLELAPGPSAAAAEVPISARPLETGGAIAERPLGSVTLRGQIIDPKCHFGAMKPGEGKVHRACAVRCISGGVPPVLMVRERDGAGERLRYYALLDPAGKPVNDRVLDVVGEPVEITGAATQLLSLDGKIVGEDSLRALRFDPGTIKRIP